MANERVQELYQQLDEGVQKFRSSDEWRGFLKFQSRFHQYSFGNTLLIYMQKPHASRVAGFHTWLDMGRAVKKGEKAIHILAPLVRKVKDDKTGEEVRKVFGFKGACVFDLSQTDGEDIPDICPPLASSSEMGQRFYDSLRQIITIPVEFEDIQGQAKGYYSPGEHRIALRNGLTADQQAKTLCHEYVHSLLHHKNSVKVAADHRECVAEGTAYVVANYFGLDTAEYSFAYVTAWSGDDSDLIQNIGAEIQQTASRIIGEIEALTSKKQKVA